MTISEYIKSLEPTRREHWMMLLIFLYNIITPISYVINIEQPILNALTCIIGFVFTLLLVCNLKGIPLSGRVRFFYIILFIWSVWLTFHMFFITGFELKDNTYKGITTILLLLFRSHFFLPNLMPFVLMVLSEDEFDFQYLWKLMWLSCILYFCLYPFAIWSVTHYTLKSISWYNGYGDFVKHSTLGISTIAPCIIMVYLKRYIQPKQWTCFLMATIGGLLLTAYMARRASTVMCLIYLSACWMLYAFQGNGYYKTKMVVAFCLVALLGYALFSGLNDSFFSLLQARGLTDTRSGVERNFITNMKTAEDWIFGRGWLGQYYDKMFHKYRTGIETGYMTLILRGGLIYLIAYIMCLTISVFKGIFMSKNLFCKAFAIICFIQILQLYPDGWPLLNFHHLFIWLGVMVCNSEYYRNLSDEKVTQLLF